MRLWHVALVCILASPLSAQAANPGFGGIAPYGAQRGKEIEVTLNGTRLTDAQEVLLYYPGITVTQFAVASDTQVKAKFNIAADFRLGIHALRIRTASGISDLRQVSVGALPDVAEKEPNNDFAVPQKIEMGVTVNGVAQNEDVDYYLVEVKQGERISAEIEGIRLGMTFFDPYVAIQDMGRFELASSDDAALVWQDCVASIVAPKDGAYVIQVWESSFGGNGACAYRLHVGRFPRPTGVLPAGGKPGETLSVKWLGDPAGERVEQITLPAQPWRLFGLYAVDALGIAPSPNAFRINDLPNVLETEPNNALAEATAAAEAPVALNGVITQEGDVDAFKFPAKKGQVFDVRVHARSIRSPLDPVLVIQRASNGAAIGNNDDSGQVDSYLRFTAPEDDQYVVTVRDHLNQGGVNYTYRAEVTPVQPKLSLGLPERQQYVDVTVSVPKGNRTAFMVNANRQDFGGDLALEIRDMPAGLALQTVPMAANQTVIPVLLTAAGDANPAGSLADIVGKPADANLKIEGHLVQDSLLVRGQNNSRVWGHVADRMALAVTDEAPFKIEIVQPKVPIVRNGSMNLKVVATRKEEFKAPINIRMLYNPAGIGSASSVTIPEGQTEGLIPLNANNAAEIKTWKIVVMGEATVGNGPVLISSQLADLEIAEAFFGFTFDASAVEQGKETEVLIKIAKQKDFEGNAKVELLGLPNEVTTEPVEFNKDATELVFKVKTTEKSPAGKHKTLLCRAVITQNGEPITHGLGPGELRIDVPLPPKPMAVAQPAAPTPMPTPMPVAQKPPEKRLTRLEQLRLEREQAKKTEAAPAAAAPAPATPAPAAPAAGK